MNETTVTTPSELTRTPRLALAVLPARSTASAATVSTSPETAHAGTDSARRNGGASNVPASPAQPSRPLTSTRIVTRASPTLSAAVARASPGRPRERLSGADSAMTGGIESLVIRTSTSER